MRATSKTTVSTVTAWADGLVRPLEAQDAAARQREQESHDRATRVQAIVGQQSAMWMQRIAGALESLASALNERLGRRQLDVRRTSTGLVSLADIKSGAYVLFAQDLQLDEHNAGGVTVTTQMPERRWVVPYDFEISNEELRIRYDGGELLQAEAFTRRAVETWLKGIPLNGR